MQCSPFTLKFFQVMVHQSVPLSAIAGTAGLQNQYTSQAISEMAAENELLWLIQVGLLRREVDGQGLTNSFRVTPLGRQLLQNWQDGGRPIKPVPSLGDRLYNTWSRWFRLPV
jgi:hypothetical protein